MNKELCMNQKETKTGERQVVSIQKTFIAKIADIPQGEHSQKEHRNSSKFRD